RRIESVRRWCADQVDRLPGSGAKGRSTMLTVIRLFIAMIAALATALGGAVAVQAAPSDDSSGMGASLSASGRWYGAIAIAFDDGAAGWSYDYKTKRKALNRAQKECKKFSDFPSS